MNLLFVVHFVMQKLFNLFHAVSDDQFQLLLFKGKELCIPALLLSVAASLAMLGRADGSFIAGVVNGFGLLGREWESLLDWEVPQDFVFLSQLFESGCLGVFKLFESGFDGPGFSDVGGLSVVFFVDMGVLVRFVGIDLFMSASIVA